MKFHATIIDGCWLIEPEPHHDHRGSFMRTYCREEFSSRGLCNDFVQCNLSANFKRGTLRGMHYQVEPFEECKIVQCVRGSLFDVVLDLRPTSTTYLKWVSHALDAIDRRMVCVPAGCAHGFQTLENNTDILYQISAPHSPDHARGARWNDPAFEIQWPIPDPIMSQRDRSFPMYEAMMASKHA